MKEYEYSFEVKDTKPYINHCKENGYQLIEESSQTRVLYKNDNKTLARITTKKINNNVETYLDFKDENDTDEILKISRETVPLKITKENQKAINSILEFFKYEKTKELVRNRVVYQKNNVTFEIDSYEKPEIMYVVAIEGEKEEVDIVYNELKEIN